MELLDLPQLADRAGLPPSLARYYRDRYVMFVPSIRVGRTVMHPEEAVDALTLIAEQARAGVSAAEIETALERAYPVTVITSQQVSSDGGVRGPMGAVAALASALDERGSRVESEVGALKERLETIAAALEPSSTPEQTVPTRLTLAVDDGGELAEMRRMIGEMQTQIATLASHDQLEWIGDVVSAAVLRPAEPGSRDSIERRLTEIQQEMRKPRPDADVAELRVAVERLSEHVHARDEDYHRVLQSLVGAMRAEVATLHAGIKELRRPSNDEIPPLPLLLTGHRAEATAIDLPKSDAAPAETGSNGDAHRSRAPRRLGQPNRPADLTGTDQLQPPAADS
jgi:hypothetical protein